MRLNFLSVNAASPRRVYMENFKNSSAELADVAGHAVRGGRILGCYVNDKIAPTLGTFRPVDALPATG